MNKRKVRKAVIGLYYDAKEWAQYMFVALLVVGMLHILLTILKGSI